MRALVLAAGLGTRLRPLTYSTPKCLVRVGDEVLLGNWLRRLQGAGIERVLVNLHHLADQVVNWVQESPYHNFVDFVYEEQLLGTAGTIHANSHYFGNEQGLVIHADNFCAFEIAEFVDAHQLRPKSAEMSLVAFRTADPAQCGIFELDEEFLMQRYWEKSPEVHGNLANGGVYLLPKEVREKCAGSADFAAEILPRLAGSVFVWEQRGPFYDVGTPESLAQAHGEALERLLNFEINDNGI